MRMLVCARVCLSSVAHSSDLAFCGMFGSPQHRKHLHTYAHVKGESPCSVDARLDCAFAKVLSIFVLDFSCSSCRAPLHTLVHAHAHRHAHVRASTRRCTGIYTHRAMRGAQRQAPARSSQRYDRVSHVHQCMHAEHFSCAQLSCSFSPSPLLAAAYPCCHGLCDTHTREIGNVQASSCGQSRAHSDRLMSTRSVGAGLLSSTRKLNSRVCVHVCVVFCAKCIVLVCMCGKGLATLSLFFFCSEAKYCTD